MSYAHRVFLALALLFAIGAAGTGALLYAARGMAEDDMRVGHGPTRFPPQHATPKGGTR